MQLFICSLCLFSFIVFLVFVWLFVLKQRQTAPGRRICVVVLGDVGRSPRMQYHALSCAKEGFHVDLVGFGNSPLIQELEDHPSVRLLALKETPQKPTFLPQIIYYIFKAIFLFTQLVWLVLFKTPRHSHMLVQNPPAIPTLAAAWLICLVRQCKLIIDWHNYGYTILSLALGKRHPLVTFSRIYEGFLGRRAAYNICVSRAMKFDLIERWGITASTLYDRPPERFQSVDSSSRHNLFVKLSATYEVFKPTNKQSGEETRFSALINNTPKLKTDRPALLISSTSWTKDEDFSILLNALESYDKLVQKDYLRKLPKIVCVITGKGPLKAHYQEYIATLELENVHICTPWLDAGDYPKLVGSADLGICLHTSSSGLDLPMKVVDMFGCGVPVCAVKYPCLHELVKHGQNGLMFEYARDLSEQLADVLWDFPSDQRQLDKFRENLKDFQSKRWHACWKSFYNTKLY